MNADYYVQSPWTNAREEKMYKLVHVTFEEVGPTLTATGHRGQAVNCKIEFWNGKFVFGTAVCNLDEDRFDFVKGAKLALKRALDMSKKQGLDITKEFRTSIWNGFKLFVTGSIG